MLIRHNLGPIFWEWHLSVAVDEKRHTNNRAWKAEARSREIKDPTKLFQSNGTWTKL